MIVAKLLRFLPLAGWPLAAIMFGLWLSARDEVVQVREQCNTEKLAEALESERVVRAAQDAANERERIRLVNALEAAERATAMERESRELAESRPAEVRTEIREVAGECLDQNSPDAALDAIYR